MSEGEYCVVSDEGSLADLDVDRLDNVDYDDSDVWSVTVLVIAAQMLIWRTIVSLI